MVNSEDFIKRLEFILDYYSLSASGFADKIGVQRSSLSHLLSGRNKPSLDFILKILEFFPEIDLYWILNGQGSFPKNEIEKSTLSPNLNDEKNNTDDLIKTIPKEINFPIISQEEIEKIVIFYTNGKFKEFNPK